MSSMPFCSRTSSNYFSVAFSFHSLRLLRIPSLSAETSGPADVQYDISNAHLMGQCKEEERMSQLVYVLIEAEVGKSHDIVTALKGTKGLREASIVTGPYSIIAIYSGTDANTVSRLVIDSIHGIPGVLRTISCLALD